MFSPRVLMFVLCLLIAFTRAADEGRAVSIIVSNRNLMDSNNNGSSQLKRNESDTITQNNSSLNINTLNSGLSSNNEQETYSNSTSNSSSGGTSSNSTSNSTSDNSTNSTTNSTTEDTSSNSTSNSSSGGTSSNSTSNSTSDNSTNSTTNSTTEDTSSNSTSNSSSGGTSSNSTNNSTSDNSTNSTTNSTTEDTSSNSTSNSSSGGTSSNSTSNSTSDNSTNSTTNSTTEDTSSNSTSNSSSGGTSSNSTSNSTSDNSTNSTTNSTTEDTSSNSTSNSSSGGTSSNSTNNSTSDNSTNSTTNSTTEDTSSNSTSNSSSGGTSSNSTSNSTSDNSTNSTTNSTTEDTSSNSTSNSSSGGTSSNSTNNSTSDNSTNSTTNSTTEDTSSNSTSNSSSGGTSSNSTSNSTSDNSTNSTTNSTTEDTSSNSTSNSSSGGTSSNSTSNSTSDNSTNSTTNSTTEDTSSNSTSNSSSGGTSSNSTSNSTSDNSTNSTTNSTTEDTSSNSTSNSSSGGTSSNSTNNSTSDNSTNSTTNSTTEDTSSNSTSNSSSGGTSSNSTNNSTSDNSTNSTTNSTTEDTSSNSTSNSSSGGTSSNSTSNSTSDNSTNSTTNSTTEDTSSNSTSNSSSGGTSSNSTNNSTSDNSTNSTTNSTTEDTSSNSTSNSSSGGTSSNSTSNSTSDNSTNSTTNSTTEDTSSNSTSNSSSGGTSSNSTSNSTSDNSTNSTTNSTTEDTSSNSTSNSSSGGTSSNSTSNSTSDNSTNSTTNSTTEDTSSNSTINSSFYSVVLQKSATDRLFYGSSRLQSISFKFNNSTLTPNITTTFLLATFNSSSSGSLKNYLLTSTGSWSFITSTQATLSCIIVYQAATNSYGLLQFLSDQQSFSILAIMPASQITSDPLTPDDAKANILARQNCDAVYYKYNLYRLVGSKFVEVPTPPGWSRSSSPENIRFGVVNNILYRYNTTSATFISLYTFPNSSAYEIRNSPNRLLVVAANITASNGISTFSQKMYLFQVLATGNISIITDITFTAFLSKNTSEVYPFLASPLLTKIGVIIRNGTNSSSTIILKSIDSTTNAVTGLVFQQPARFIATISRVALDAPKFFGDSFFVVRNDSAAPLANVSYVEEAYQFVSNQVIYLKSRVLAANDTTNFINTYVDSTNFNQNQLVVLNSFNTTEGLGIQQLPYGNLASVVKIMLPTTPPYISFVIPTGATSLTIPTNSTTPLYWLYVNPASTTTNITVIQSNASFPNNIKINRNTLPGSLEVMTMNSNCYITRSNNIFTLASFATVTNISTYNSSDALVLINITSLLANISINNATKWGLSSRCRRFSVNTMLFAKFNQTAFLPVDNFSASALSSNLDAAIVEDSIWLLNSRESRFSQVPNMAVSLVNPEIIRQESRIMITSTNSTTAIIKAYQLEITGTLTSCLDYTFSTFDEKPKIHVSSKMTKVLITGPYIPADKNQSQPRFDFYNIVYSDSTYLSLSFPSEKVADLTNSQILLDDQFFYIRPLATDNSSSSQNYQESVYFISNDVTPLLASSTSLTQAQLNTWKRTTFLQLEDNKINILTEYQQTTDSINYVVVNTQQVSGQQASLNSDSSRGISGVLDSSGKIKLCTGGCSGCSSGTCTGCTRGYFFDDTTSHCLPCGSNCAACSNWIYPSCTSCLSNSYLTANNTCVRCDTNCATCSGNATTCTSCLPGQSLNERLCNAYCPKNCITCDGSTCLTCISGFIVSNGSCRGCVASCSSCSAYNITQCTSCAPGLTLVSSACVPCPDKCQTCSSGVCATCIPGYSPNTNGVCVLACQISCATCADNQPSVCLSCYSGAYLNESTCILNTTCNNDFSCTYCGQGLGFYLVSTTCIPCTLSNCSQCNPVSTNQQCSKCFNGYYLDSSNFCQACPSNCITCKSIDACTGCVVGYTLPQLQTEGQCIACKSPCVSCLGVSTYCLSCVDGYTKTGWKCQSNKYVGFSFVLVGAAPADVLSAIDNVAKHLVILCNLNDTSLITFNTITSASTSVTGSSTSSDPVATSKALSTALAQGNLGGYVVGSVSVTANGVSSNSSQSSQLSIGAIVGIVIGIIAFIELIVIVICVIYRRKKSLTQDPTQVVVIKDKNAVKKITSIDKSDSTKDLHTAYFRQLKRMEQ